jgi:threonyl-tRNA synthetase
VQVKVISISEKFEGYAHKVTDALRDRLIRAELDTSNETFNKKVRNNTTRRVPILLIAGEREMLEGTATVRRYKIKEQQTMTIDEIRTMILDEIKTRRHVRAL